MCRIFFKFCLMFCIAFAVGFVLTIVCLFSVVHAQATPVPNEPDTFSIAVAARCKGESSFAIRECACTVKNRLLNGWTEQNVLSAYYAPDVTPTPLEEKIAHNALHGFSHCHPDIYFMFAVADCHYLGIENLDPILTVKGATGEVRFFEYWYSKRKE